MDLNIQPLVTEYKDHYTTAPPLQVWPLGSMSSLGSFSTISVEEARVDMDWRTVAQCFIAVVTGRTQQPCANFQLLHVLGNVTVSCSNDVLKSCKLNLSGPAYRILKQQKRQAFLGQSSKHRWIAAIKIGLILEILRQFHEFLGTSVRKRQN